MTNYEDIQKQKNAQAERDYAALLPTLSPDIQAILTTTDKKGKKHLRMDDGNIANHSPFDAAKLPEPSESFDFADLIDRLENRLIEAFGLTAQQAAGVAVWHHRVIAEEAMRGMAVRLARLTGLLLSHSNLTLVVHALAYATHTAKANGLGSMRQACARILKSNGKPVGVAALSKMACWLVGFLDLPPGEGMKSDAAVRAYSESAKKSHVKRRSKKLQKAIDRLKSTSSENP